MPHSVRDFWEAERRAATARHYTRQCARQLETVIHREYGKYTWVGAAPGAFRKAREES